MMDIRHLNKTVCIFNDGVDCSNHFCNSCGWNPTMTKIRPAKDVIPDRLKAFLEKREITQAGFAEMVSVDPTTVSRWITKTQIPSVEMLRTICRVTGISADYLLGLENDNGQSIER